MHSHIDVRLRRQTGAKVTATRMHEVCSRLLAPCRRQAKTHVLTSFSGVADAVRWEVTRCHLGPSNHHRCYGQLTPFFVSVGPMHFLHRWSRLTATAVLCSALVYLPTCHLCVGFFPVFFPVRPMHTYDGYRMLRVRFPCSARGCSALSIRGVARGVTR